MKEKPVRTIKNKVKKGGSAVPVLMLIAVLCAGIYIGGVLESGQTPPYNPFFVRVAESDYVQEGTESVSYTYPNKVAFIVRTETSDVPVSIDCGDGNSITGVTMFAPDAPMNGMEYASTAVAYLYYTYNSVGTYTAKLYLDGEYTTSSQVDIPSLTAVRTVIDDFQKYWYSDGTKNLGCQPESAYVAGPSNSFSHHFNSKNACESALKADLGGYNLLHGTPQLTWYEQMWYEFKDWWTHLFNPKTYDSVSTVVSSQDVVAIESPFSYTAENSSTDPCTITFDASDARNYFGTHNSDGTLKDDWTYHQNDFPLDKSYFNFSWDFGDGSTGTGTKVTHTYTCDCQKTVTLSAVVTSINCVDKDGNPIVCPPSAFYVTYAKTINTCAHPVVIPVDPLPPTPTPTTYTTYWYDNTTKNTGCQVATRTEGVAYMYQGLYEFDTMTACENARTSENGVISTPVSCGAPWPFDGRGCYHTLPWYTEWYNLFHGTYLGFKNWLFGVK